ncbi:hypothetical protein JB92DRAFT_2884107 [Gautieria morchelliformis]|nr:hypothetical protein JB92DRAFT_2884107 [Gautieria morchelliformis]
MTRLNPSVGARPYPCSKESSSTHTLDPMQAIASIINTNTQRGPAEMSISSSFLAVEKREVLLSQDSSSGGNAASSALCGGGNDVSPLSAFLKSGKNARVNQPRGENHSRCDTGPNRSNSASRCSDAAGHSSTSPASLVSTTAEPKARLDSGSQAAIAISVLFLLAILAIGVIYFKRRKGRMNRTFSGNRGPVNADPESAVDEHFAGRTDVSAAMSREREISADAVTRTGDSSPDPFFSALGIPAKDSTHPPPQRVSLDYASSRTSDDLGHCDLEMKTRPAASPTFSSSASASPDVPFFRQLKAMRRRGELRKPPTPTVAFQNIESSDDEGGSAEWTGADSNAHECSNIPDNDVHAI